MSPEQFTYWLQGYSEIAGSKPNKEQWQVIQDHLKLVFDKKTPIRLSYPSEQWVNPMTSAEPQCKTAASIC